MDRYVRSHLVAESHAVVSTECSHLPLGHCLVPGWPIPHWGITLSSVIATRRSFLRVRLLLVGCGGLMDDLGRFHGESSSACPLCHYVCEDALHLLRFVPIYILLVLLFWPLHHPAFLLLLMILSSCVMWFSGSVGSLISLYRYF